MQDFISEFYDFLITNGFDPAGGTKIIPDNKRHRFKTTGRKDESGVYCLDITGDFAYGYAKDYRSGVCLGFSSKSKRRLTNAERENLKLEIEASKAKAALELQKARALCRAKAERIWGRIHKDGPQTPYEARKGIQRYGVCTIGDNLVVPVTNGDEIVSLQFISPDGTKKFLRDTDKTGNYFPIGESPARGEKIILCEGYATGASIHEATGIYTIVCFDAGNILPVAKKLCKKYDIIFAADNDEATVINGVSKNTGLLSAEQAAKDVGGVVCAPPSLEGIEHLPRSRDFNDLHKECGLDAVREAILGKKVVTIEPKNEIEPGTDDWREGLIRNSKGDLDAKSITNIDLYLTHHSQIKGCFAFDRFAIRTIVHRCPPWEPEKTFKVRELRSTDIQRLQVWLEGHGLKIGKDMVYDTIASVADKNGFHPAREYLSSLEWDGKNRLDFALKEIYACTDDPRYLAVVFRKWMVAAVKRVFEPGCKFDSMLIIEGPQNIGKSSSLGHLSTFNGVSYFADNIKNINDKDTLMTMNGKLIIEFAELSSWHAAETNDLKAFMSRQVDMYRPPYDRTVMEVPRQCVFAGTTNPTGGYFRDATGNRRYWPVYATKINFNILFEWRDQLWAEAVHLYHAGEKIWLEGDEYQIAEKEQSKRYKFDAWFDDIEQLCIDRDFVSYADIYEGLNIERSRKDFQSKSRITSIMTSLGYKEIRKTVLNKKVSGWALERKDTQIVLEEIEWN